MCAIVCTGSTNAARNLQSADRMQHEFRCDWPVLSFNVSVATRSRSPSLMVTDASFSRSTSKSSSLALPAYWINLDDNIDRRDYMNKNFEVFGHQLGIGSNRRISAVKPDTEAFRITKLEKPCKRNTDGDLAIILSHLTAIYRAIKDTSPMAQHNPYALILEDDVEFHLKADLRKVIQSAPADFGVLQLTTTNTEALTTLWGKFEASGFSSFWTPNKWSDTTKNGKYTLYWGALGYVIQKKVVEPFIDRVVDVAADGSLSFKIINSFFPDKCIQTKDRPCVLANCLFSDSYIYSAAGPTYVSHFPILTSGKNMGLNSTAHQTHVPAHIEAFQEIQKLLDGMRATPHYAKCKKKGHDTAGKPKAFSRSSGTNNRW